MVVSTGADVGAGAVCWNVSLSVLVNAGGFFFRESVYNLCSVGDVMY